jgi:hypothetical protein
VAVNLGDSSRICRSSDIFPLLAPTTGVKESGGFKIERERERGEVNELRRREVKSSD